MQSAEKMLSLKWTSFPSQLAISMDTCYEKQQFVDVSLVCKDGTILKCHKMILANASTFFSRLLIVANDHPHPMIILHDIEADDLKTIINFMYCGEIQVVQSEVRRLLKIANILEVTGLTQIQTIETGSPISHQHDSIFETASGSKNNNNNGTEVINSFNKSIIGQRFDSSSSNSSGGTRFDSNITTTTTTTISSNNRNYETNNSNPFAGSKYEVNSPRYDYNSSIRFDGNSTGLRYETGRMQITQRLPLRNNREILSPKKLEITNRCSQESRKEISTEIIQNNRLRLAKAGIDIQEVNRPGTSRSPQLQQLGTKRKESESNPLSWTRVLNMLSRDNQLPVKKLCMMDEVEISPSKITTQQSQSSIQFSPRASNSLEPIELFIKDDNEFPFETNNANI
ncbi:protein abrupt-like [Leptopilina boulardi]|uniref:protein abrupt-like n=1 Tax=Leptopilina boulardi TaxID=63433 RepID=UPI0021F65E2A|nr:protein abrupt-like [Leptopilina boulardi]